MMRAVVARDQVNLYTLVEHELCPSVSTLLRSSTGSLVSLDSTSLSGNLGDSGSISLVRGKGVFTKVEVSKGASSIVFRQSQHIVGAKIVELSECGSLAGSISVVVSHYQDECHFFGLKAALGILPNGPGDPHLFLMPQGRSGLFVFQLTDEPGQREADFCLMTEGLGYFATSFRRGDVIQCFIDDAARELLNPMGLGDTTLIEVYGVLTTTLCAMARGLRLVFLNGKTVLSEFPPQASTGYVF